MAIACNNEGVQELKKLAARLPELLEEIKEATNTLEDCASDQEVLGPHASQIVSILENIKTAAKNAQDPVNHLSAGISKTAAGYEEVIAAGLVI